MMTEIIGDYLDILMILSPPYQPATQVKFANC